MKTFQTIGWLSCVVWLLACQVAPTVAEQSTEHANPNNTPSKSEEAMHQTATHQPTMSQHAETLTIKTTPCYGRCPVYSVTLTPAGKLTFIGERFVAQKGEVLRDIPVELAQQIFSEMQAYRPETGTSQENAECVHRATDHPSYVLTWRAHDDNGGVIETEYHHYTGCSGAQNRDITKQLQAVIESLNIADLLSAPQFLTPIARDDASIEK